MRSPSTRLIAIPFAALFAGAAAFTSCARSPERAAGGVTTHGEWVKIPRGADTIRAYVAYPERSSRAPGIIVIHEIMGLTDWEPTVADRLAGAGYVAIAPDLLSSRFGLTPASSDSARVLIGQLEPDRITADLDAVYAYLDSVPAVERGEIGTIGFCWGGQQNFRYATNNPRLRAAVVCYGPAPDSAALARIEAPVLGIYGENDARVNTPLPDVRRQMAALGKSFEMEIYEGTGHGFLKPGRRGSDTPAVDRAWERILGFYRARLGT